MELAKPSPIHVLTVNFHTLIRDAVCVLLGQAPDLTALPQSFACGDAFPPLTACQPDVLLFNLDDCPHPHLECMAQLRASVPTARILVITSNRDIKRFRAAIVRGAFGVLMKAGAATLIEAIYHIHKGRAWLDYETVSQLIPADRFAPNLCQDGDEAIVSSSLTAREQQVLDLLCEGMNYHEVADCLGNSIPTVRSQAASIMLKLGLKGRSELVAYAYSHGMVRQPLQRLSSRKDKIIEFSKEEKPKLTSYVPHKKTA